MKIRFTKSDPILKDISNTQGKEARSLLISIKKLIFIQFSYKLCHAKSPRNLHLTCKALQLHHSHIYPIVLFCLLKQNKVFVTHLKLPQVFSFILIFHLGLIVEVIVNINFFVRNENFIIVIVFIFTHMHSFSVKENLYVVTGTYILKT